MTPVTKSNRTLTAATGPAPARRYPPTIVRRLGGRRAPVLVGALAAAVLVSACGGSSSKNEETSGGTGKPLDISRVEKAIEESVVRQRHLHTVVTCPAVEQKKGLTFTCYASGTVTKNGHTESFKTPFTVEQVNSSGSVYYHS